MLFSFWAAARAGFSVWVKSVQEMRCHERMHTGSKTTLAWKWALMWEIHLPPESLIEPEGVGGWGVGCSDEEMSREVWVGQTEKRLKPFASCDNSITNELVKRWLSFTGTYGLSYKPHISYQGKAQCRSMSAMPWVWGFVMIIWPLIRKRQKLTQICDQICECFIQLSCPNLTLTFLHSRKQLLFGLFLHLNGYDGVACSMSTLQVQQAEVGTLIW